MMLYEIKHRHSVDVLFSFECAALKLCVEAAARGGADLRGAYLRGADLGGADLRGADLRGADLRGATEGEKYKVSAHGVVQAGDPDNWSALGYEDEATKQIRLQVGCRRFSLEEGRAYWAGKPARREVLAALDYIEAVLTIRRERAAAQGDE